MILSTIYIYTGNVEVPPPPVEVLEKPQLFIFENGLLKEEFCGNELAALEEEVTEIM